METLSAQTVETPFIDIAAHVQRTFDRNMELYGPQLFRTREKGLFTAYLSGFEPNAVTKQWHNCNTCASFIRKIGHAVFIKDDGSIVSACWDETDVPESHRAAIAALRKEVESRKVTGVFGMGDGTFDIDFGAEERGGFHHFHLAYRPVFTGSERIGKDEAIKKFIDNIMYTDIAVFNTAILMFKSGKLNMPEKFLPQVELLHEFRMVIASGNPNWYNVLRKRAAGIDDTFLYYKGHALGELLDKIATGQSQVYVENFWNRLIVAPTKYMRPTEAPTQDNIDRAERLIADLDLGPALQRQYAPLADVIQYAHWVASVKPEAEQKESVFGHLAAKDAKPANQTPPVDGGLISWEKFLDTVLPEATNLAVRIPARSTLFGGIIGPAVADAKPILAYDKPECRNPYNWFMPATPQFANGYGLAEMSYTDVEAMLKPVVTWNGNTSHADYNKIYLLVPKGVVPRIKTSLCLFPEILIPELYGIRQTIESYSNSKELPGGEVQGLACGVYAHRGMSVEITNQYGRVRYEISEI